MKGGRRKFLKAIACLVAIGLGGASAALLVMLATPQAVQSAAPFLELLGMLGAGIGGSAGAHWVLERLVGG